MSFTPEQKLYYVKLMVEDNYTTQQIIDISGAGSTAVTRWKKQYLSELKGETPTDKKALTAEQQKIQSLEQQLWRAKRDNEILKRLPLSSFGKTKISIDRKDEESRRQLHVR